MKQTVLIVLADGFEEIEAVTPIDVLRRAALEVTVAGVEKKEIVGSRGLKIVADILLSEYKGLPDALILPGGSPGAENLRKSAAVQKLLTQMQDQQKWIGAICASPAVVLAPAGILDGKKATCYPGYEKQFGRQTVFEETRVVRDGHLITSRGPGTAFEFSLALVEALRGKEIANKLSEVMVVSR